MNMLKDNTNINKNVTLWHNLKQFMEVYFFSKINYTFIYVKLTHTFIFLFIYLRIYVKFILKLLSLCYLFTYV